MSKLFLGFLIFLSATGCGKEPPAVEPTPEQAPWLFPEKQIELLKASDSTARALAARNLGNMGSRAESAIPELKNLLEDENPKVRELAKEALEKIFAEVGDGESN